MRWSERISPSIGSIRMESGFAFLPKKINKYDTVWLEKYHRTMIYHEPRPVQGMSFFPGWYLYDVALDEVYEPISVRGHFRGWVPREFQRPQPPRGAFATDPSFSQNNTPMVGGVE